VSNCGERHLIAELGVTEELRLAVPPRRQVNAEPVMEPAG